MPWLSRPGAAVLLWFFHFTAPPAWIAPGLALVLHAAASVLLATVLPQLFTRRATVLAVLIYAAHPLHTDSLALPLVALSAFAALLLEQADLRLSAVYIAALALLSWNYARLWRDPVTLNMEAARLAPRLPAPVLALAPHLPPTQALELIADARRHAPSDPRLGTAFGNALLRAQRPREALSEFALALDLDPRFHAAWTGRASGWLALERPGAARADLLRALALEPCSLNARLALSRLGGPLPRDPGCPWTRAQRRALAAATSRR